jgi:hypothetical protein
MTTNVKEPAGLFRIEPRWPVALAILAVSFLLAVLPGRVRLFPAWFPYLLGIMLIVTATAHELTAAKARWFHIERIIMLLFVVVTGLGTLANLANLIGAMVHRSSEIGGLQLLTSSISVWVTNVIMFSLLYICSGFSLPKIFRYDFQPFRWIS